MKYKYTVDMAMGFRATAMRVFEKFIGEPIAHLEIGVYEGLSGCFMLDNILTHPRASYLGIDPYEDPHAHAYDTAVKNLNRHYKDVTLLRGYSFNFLPDLLGAKFSFDTIYIDGCHSYGGCKLDLEQSWPLLKPGGIILCDDFNREDYGVKQAVFEFLDGLNPTTFTITHEDYQIAWEKLA